MKRVFMLLFVVALVVMSGALAAQDDMTYTVMLGGNDDLGTFFVDADGMTLYIFTNDEAGVSNCNGDCATAWPPLTVSEEEAPTLDPAISGLVRFISRDDGTRQVTYNGMPLYYWSEDSAPGDATGQGLGDVWFVATMPQVGLSGNDDLGSFLVGESGYTLYVFTNDEAGVSNCNGDCATAWPPLTVESEDAFTWQPGLAGEFGFIEREDGSLQVTLNDAPLYFWMNDEAPGDTTGQGVGDVWFVATLPTVAVAENDEFGQILTGANGMTLYTLTSDADAPGTSVCVGGCAVAWPPLTVVDGEAISAMDGVSGELGTIEREDGSLQVTYNGAPLYYWINDIVAGDTTGQGVGDVWFVAQP